ncbi:MAG TPA: ACP S-malonyltransferase [Thermomicrobiales bacterium]|nr:ACP S-malonyltransferase [Thermomicrobiales bacterium]
MTTPQDGIAAGRTVWLFPGQGSQRVGMAVSLADEPVAQAILQEADDALGFSLSGLIADGPATDLEQTANQQPAILAVSIAWHAVLRDRGLLPEADFVAGHSLGEYSALVAGGALGLADAVRLVRRRGQLMQQHGAGGMAAVLGLDLSKVEELASTEGVEVANINAPGQVVVSGADDAIDRVVAAAKGHGAKRAIRLPVSGAFHSSMMAPVVDELGPEIDGVTMNDLAVPLISNVDASPIAAADKLRRELRDQICAPVRWVDVIGRLATEGVTTGFEVGPGKVLAGLVGRICPGITVTAAESLVG